MTTRAKVRVWLPATLCFVSLLPGCFDGYKPPTDPSDDRCDTWDPCSEPGDACFNRCPSGSTCDQSTNICAPDWSPSSPRTDAGPPPLKLDAAAPRSYPDAGVSADAGADSKPPSPACSACDVPPPNTPAPIVTPLCQFNHQCGRSGRCVDGACQAACTSSASCGSGDVCHNGFCQADPDGSDACVFNSQCADGVCINGTCHAKCATSCANTADICDQGVCKPNRNPSPQCKRSLDCAGFAMCVDGVCRTSCVDNRSCGAPTSGMLCMMGYCLAPQEVAPECDNKSQCDASKSCVNAVCCTP